MDGFRNVKHDWTRLGFAVALALLVPTAAVHADELIHSAPTVRQADLPGQINPSYAAPKMSRPGGVDLRAFVQSAGQAVERFQNELAAELVATQLPLIGGHVAPPTNTSPPPSPPTSPTTQGGTPPSSPPPPPPPPPTSSGGTPPTGGNSSPPSSAPEPASLVTALVGAGLASLTAWRQRRRRAA